MRKDFRQVADFDERHRLMLAAADEALRVANGDRLTRRDQRNRCQGSQQAYELPAAEVLFQNDSRQQHGDGGIQRGDDHGFVQAPALWCGLVRDPISGRPFKPSPHSPEAYWVGGPYFFESDSTKQRFIDSR